MEFYVYNNIKEASLIVNKLENNLDETNLRRLVEGVTYNIS